MLRGLFPKAGSVALLLCIACTSGLRGRIATFTEQGDTREALDAYEKLREREGPDLEVLQLIAQSVLIDAALSDDDAAELAIAELSRAGTHGKTALLALAERNQGPVRQAKVLIALLPYGIARVSEQFAELALRHPAVAELRTAALARVAQNLEQADQRGAGAAPVDEAALRSALRTTDNRSALLLAALKARRVTALQEEAIAVFQRLSAGEDMPALQANIELGNTSATRRFLVSPVERLREVAVRALASNANTADSVRAFLSAPDTRVRLAAAGALLTCNAERWR